MKESQGRKLNEILESFKKNSQQELLLRDFISFLTISEWVRNSVSSDEDEVQYREKSIKAWKSAYKSKLDENLASYMKAMEGLDGSDENAPSFDPEDIRSEQIKLLESFDEIFLNKFRTRFTEE